MVRIETNEKPGVAEPRSTAPQYHGTTVGAKYRFSLTLEAYRDTLERLPFYYKVKKYHDTPRYKGTFCAHVA